MADNPGATRKVKPAPLFTGNSRRNSQVLDTSLFLNGLSEHAQKVVATDLRNFIHVEAGLQHGTDNDIVETGRFILPCLIRAFAYARTLSAGGRTARTRPTGMRFAGRGAIGARTRLSELGIGADANMIDSDDIDERPNISRIFQRRIGQMCPDTDQSP